MSEPIRPSARLSLAAAFTTLTSLTGLGRLVQPKLWFLECVLLFVVVMASGHLTRLALRGRGGWLNSVVIAVQVVCGALVYVALTVPGSAPLGCIPSPGALRAISTLFSAGSTAIADAAPPAVPVPGLVAILCLVGLGLALVIDALAVTFHRAVLTGLPVLATVLVPATRLPSGPGAWFAFIVASAGYLALLNIEGQAKLQRWGQLNTAPANQGVAREDQNKGATHQPLAARIAVVSVVAALILPTFVPSLNGLLHTGQGTGPAANGTYSLSTDVDLRNSLTSTNAYSVLDYTSNATDISNEYLGMSYLDTFDGNAWTAGAPKTPNVQGPPVANQGKSSPVPGLTVPKVTQSQVLTKVTVVGNFAFTTLPTPYATAYISGVANTTTNPSAATVPGPLSFTTSDPNGSQEGLQYQSTSTDVVPSKAQMESSPAVNPAKLAQYLQLPSNLPALVQQTADQVTAGDTTPYDKAMALQNYFLANFTYDLSVPATDGSSAIVNFLTSKQGFCQQFSATMATMARLLGIPAVVEVGFTPGTKQPNNTYLVTSHDAHAWPMLYFSGIGWVRFEPTVGIAATGRGSEPSYAPAPAVKSQTGTQATTAPGANPTSTASASKCGTAVHGRSVIPTSCGPKGSTEATTSSFSYLGPLGAVPREFQRLFLTGGYALIIFKLALLLLALAYCFPAYARISRRLKRRVLVRKLNRLLARAALEGSGRDPDGADEQSGPGGGPSDPFDRLNRSLFFQATEAVWAELRENAGDLGYSWAESDTPRQATARLSREARLDDPADAAVRRITLLAEHAWYGPQSVPEPGQLQRLSTDLDLVRTGLAANADRSRRLRTALLPASSLAKLRYRRDQIYSAVYRLIYRRSRNQK